MTSKELNRDIKRLWKQYKSHLSNFREDNIDQFYKHIEDVIKPEFKRLYYADTSMKPLNADSLRYLIRLNLLLRVIPFHQFGLSIS